MSFFGRGGGKSDPDPIDPSLPDQRWYAASSARYEDTYREHVGSPETFAAAGRQYRSRGDIGVAARYFQKSIDLVHTLYCSDFERRTPGHADAVLVDDYLAALTTTLAEHPAAPVAESVREVTHRLRDIATRCQAAGHPHLIYHDGLARLRDAAPGVDVSDVLGQDPTRVPSRPRLPGPPEMAAGPWLARVRAEWPAHPADGPADLGTWREGVECYDAGGPDATRQVRLAMMVIKLRGWQPVGFGGDDTFGAVFARSRMLLMAAVAPPDQPWAGDLKEFFA